MIPIALKALCTCGHIRAEHENYNSWCKGFRFCWCGEYQQDNLKYIEMVYDKRLSL